MGPDGILRTVIYRPLDIPAHPKRPIANRPQDSILPHARYNFHMIKATEKIWHNGKLIDWNDAKIHVLSHVTSYGSSVFEGIRCYSTPAGPAVFRGTRASAPSA